MRANTKKIFLPQSAFLYVRTKRLPSPFQTATNFWPAALQQFSCRTSWFAYLAQQYLRQVPVVLGVRLVDFGWLSTALPTTVTNYSQIFWGSLGTPPAFAPSIRECFSERRFSYPTRPLLAEALHTRFKQSQTVVVLHQVFLESFIYFELFYGFQNSRARTGLLFTRNHFYSRH